MIKNLSIKNYKLFKDIEIKNISQFTLIGGKNNAGKTSLLHAMFLLFDRGRMDITVRHNHSKGMNEIPLTSGFFFEPIFSDFDSNNKIIQIKANNATYTRSINIEEITKNNISIPIQNTNSILQENNNNDPLKALKITFKNNDEIVEQSLISIYPEQNFQVTNSKKVDSARNTIIYARIPSHQNNEAQKVSELILDKQIHKLLEILQIIAPEIKNIQSIAVNNGNQFSNMLHVDIGKNKLVPLAYMGDGITRLVSIIASMYQCKNGILFIDEIENGLHHSVIKDIWKGIISLAKDINCQIIATTHSDEFLRLANEAMQDENLQKQDFSYLKLERQGDEVRIGEFDYELFDYAIENMEIR
jgi:AAA15 family ATPase/GTPase